MLDQFSYAFSILFLHLKIEYHWASSIIVDQNKLYLNLMYLELPRKLDVRSL